MSDGVFQSDIVGEDDGSVEVHIVEPMIDHLTVFRPIGYSYNGHWVMYEKPGEYVSLPVVP